MSSTKHLIDPSLVKAEATQTWASSEPETTTHWSLRAQNERDTETISLRHFPMTFKFELNNLHNSQTIPLKKKKWYGIFFLVIKKSTFCEM